jgi:hypothetical protein
MARRVSGMVGQWSPSALKVIMACLCIRRQSALEQFGYARAMRSRNPFSGRRPPPTGHSAPARRNRLRPIERLIDAPVRYVRRADLKRGVLGALVASSETASAKVSATWTEGAQMLTFGGTITKSFLDDEMFQIDATSPLGTTAVACWHPVRLLDRSTLHLRAFAVREAPSTLQH